MTICVVSSKMKLARFKKGFSVRELASASGLCPATISNIENGETVPTPRTAKKICDALGVEFDDLFECS